MSVSATRRKSLRRLHSQFVEKALRADIAMQQSGVGYEADAVHRYLVAAKARGDKPRWPKSMRWCG